MKSTFSVRDKLRDCSSAAKVLNFVPIAAMPAVFAKVAVRCQILHELQAASLMMVVSLQASAVAAVLPASVVLFPAVCAALPVAAAVLPASVVVLPAAATVLPAAAAVLPAADSDVVRLCEK